MRHIFPNIYFLDTFTSDYNITQRMIKSNCGWYGCQAGDLISHFFVYKHLSATITQCENFMLLILLISSFCGRPLCDLHKMKNSWSVFYNSRIECQRNVIADYHNPYYCQLLSFICICSLWNIFALICIKHSSVWTENSSVEYK